MEELHEAPENVAVVESNEPNLQSLNEDCVFEILNRLPTNYLYTIAETCTRLLNMAAIEYRRRHAEKYVCVSMIENNIVLLPNEHDVQMFGHKFLNLVVRGGGRNHRLDDRHLNFILLNCSTNLQILRFEEVMLRKEQLQAMKHMLHRVEKLVLHKCGMMEDIYDSLLRNCPNLKQLIMSDTYTHVGRDSNKWLLMKYPALENVHLCSVTMLSFMSEYWELFFRRNPQIKRFSCDHWYSINETDRPIKIIHRSAPNLSHLYISLRGIGHLNCTYYDLSKLCEKKSFESLELQFTGAIGQQYLDRHSKILASMGKLHALHLTDTMFTSKNASEIASLIQLKKLNLLNTTFDNEFAEIVSKKLLNLEEIYADVTNDFTPFIRNSPKLQKIVLPNTAMGELHLGWGILWLNDERTKCPNAGQIIIHVQNISTGDAEVQEFSSGMITIQTIAKDKRIISHVKNSFINL